jgi:hypothetical protein
MTVAFDEDLLAPMLASRQKVADYYRLRVYVFRAARKICPSKEPLLKAIGCRATSRESKGCQ